MNQLSQPPDLQYGKMDPGFKDPNPGGLKSLPLKDKDNEHRWQN